MSSSALYTDLSDYYDLMCADIGYSSQSLCAQRLHRLFGNSGRRHLDLACGTGAHVRHFLDAGYDSIGLDIHQPMLDRAAARCPEARFMQQDMCDFTVGQPVDLVTCFLYSVHYSGTVDRLSACFAGVHRALASGGLFCFNVVDKHRIDNGAAVSHVAMHANGRFTFSSGWYYSGEGEQQSLRLRIERDTSGSRQVWHDTHPMVAVSFGELHALLQPWFDVHLLEHDYEKILPLDDASGNALVICVKR